MKIVSFLKKNMNMLLIILILVLVVLIFIRIKRETKEALSERRRARRTGRRQRRTQKLTDSRDVELKNRATHQVKRVTRLLNLTHAQQVAEATALVVGGAVTAVGLLPVSAVSAAYFGAGTAAAAVASSALDKGEKYASRLEKLAKSANRRDKRRFQKLHDVTNHRVEITAVQRTSQYRIDIDAVNLSIPAYDAWTPAWFNEEITRQYYAIMKKDKGVSATLKKRVNRNYSMVQVDNLDAWKKQYKKERKNAGDPVTEEKDGEILWNKLHNSDNPPKFDLAKLMRSPDEEKTVSTGGLYDSPKGIIRNTPGDKTKDSTTYDIAVVAGYVAPDSDDADYSWLDYDPFMQALAILRDDTTSGEGTGIKRAGRLTRVGVAAASKRAAAASKRAAAAGEGAAAASKRVAAAGEGAAAEEDVGDGYGAAGEGAAAEEGVGEDEDEDELTDEDEDELTGADKRAAKMEERKAAKAARKAERAERRAERRAAR